ncbi:MAG: hypothetical protein AAFX58_11495 [Pseudomonadota bacterium]
MSVFRGYRRSERRHGEPTPGRVLLAAAAALAIAASAAVAQTAAARDGQVRDDTGTAEAYDAGGGEWVGLETFWLRYAARRGGLTFGRRSDYPPYASVNELDTLLIELDSGPCLMEFFHQRWRRANDVRRWDPAFNRYGSCPHVFD